MDKKRVTDLIDRVGPSLGCGDFTYGPRFIEGREDIATVTRMAENGTTYGFDTIYLVWECNGELRYRHLHDSRATKDYLSVDKAAIEGDEVVVCIGKEERRIPLANLGLGS